MTARLPMTRATLEASGFSGFVSVDALAASRCREVPALPGVYAVLSNESQARFLAKSAGGWFKGKDPTVPVAVLQGRWVADTDILYFGRSQPPLRGRVDALVQYAMGRPVAHQGGRYLWQVAGSRSFLVCWKPDTDPVGEEVRLQEGFLAAYGALPFANLRIG